MSAHWKVASVSTSKNSESSGIDHFKEKFDWYVNPKKWKIEIMEEAKEDYKQTQFVKQKKWFGNVDDESRRLRRRGSWDILCGKRKNKK